MVVQLKPHQEEVLDRLGNGKVLLGGVGSGKTVTALAYFWIKVCGGVLNDPASVANPMPIFVITTARKRDELDWQKWAGQMWLYDHITVDSYNNIEKYKDVRDAFFIFDEQRLVGSGAWSRTFIKIAKSNQWILLSATPGDVWEDYIPLFVANGWYKNRTEFKRDHCVYSYYGRFPKLERYLGVRKLEHLRDQLLVEMPFERHTKRHIHEVEVDYDRELYEKVMKQRWHVYEDRPLRDVSELFSVARKIVNSDPTRLEAIGHLMKQHPRLIVFYNFDYELEILRDILKSPGSEKIGESGPSSSVNSTPSSQEEASTDLDRTPCISTSTSAGLGAGRSLSEDGTETCLVTSTPRNGTDRKNPFTNPPVSMDGIPEMDPLNGTSTTTCRCTPETTCDSSESERPKRCERCGATSSKEREAECLTIPDTTPGSSTTNDGSVSRTNELSNSSSTTCPSSESQCLLRSPRRPSGSSSSLTTAFSKTQSESPNQETTRERLDGGPIPTTGRFPGGTTASLQTVIGVPSTSDQTSEFAAPVGFSDQIGTQARLLGGPEKASSGSTSAKVEMDSSLETDTSPPVVIAEWNGHKHEPVPDTERWVYLVQYVAGAEAWDCIVTDAMVFYSMTYSYKLFQQAQGRTDRMNTPYTDLHYYVLMSRSPSDRMIANSLKHKKSFNEREAAKALMGQNLRF